MKNLKSEIIRENLRIILFSHADKKFGKKEEIKEKEEFIIDLVRSAYHSKFRTKKAEKFFEKWPRLARTTFLRVSLDLLGIKDFKDYVVSIPISIYPKASKFIDCDDNFTDSSKIIPELFKDTELKKIVSQKLKEIAILEKEHNDIFAKYYTKIKYRQGNPRYFCLDARSTEQLKNIYPEIYEIYKNIVQSEEYTPEEKIKEDKLKNLRKYLGYV